MTNVELAQVIEKQQTTIEMIRSRMGALVDEVAVLKGNIETFKGHVADDMRRVVELVQNK